jgi:hypothetical protein
VSAVLKVREPSTPFLGFLIKLSLVTALKVPCRRTLRRGRAGTWHTDLTEFGSKDIRNLGG